MRSRFAACIDVVVTGGAGAGHNPGVGKAGGLPGCSRMAGVAGLGRRDMGSVLHLRINGNVGAVMAGRAVAGCDRACGAGVAHRCRGKSRVVLVAGVALRRRGNMDGGLAKGAGTVVARRAAACGRRAGGAMVEGGCRPGYGRVMAGIALGSGLYMGRRLGLRVLCDVGAAVAGRTLAGQPRVIHHRRRPGSVAAGMTAVALRGRRDMCGRLG